MRILFEEPGKIIKDYGWDFRLWPLAVLTGWPHLRGFIIRTCMSFSPGPKKSDRNNEVTDRVNERGFTGHKSWKVTARNSGFPLPLCLG